MEMTSSYTLLICVCFTAFCALPAAGNSCAKTPIIQRCASEYYQYAQSGGFNVIQMVDDLQNAVQNFELICRNSVTMNTCLEEALRGCDSFTDADSFVVTVFGRAEGKLKLACGNDEARRVVGKVANCLTADVAKELKTCEVSADHTCSVFEQEVHCIDEKIRKLCNDNEVTGYVSNGARIVLRDNEHSFRCTPPPMATPADNNQEVPAPKNGGNSALGVWSTAASAVSALCTLYHVYSAV